ncbi:hypothetical protein PJI17_33005, partial [Mycobacterium kansasii]
MSGRLTKWAIKLSEFDIKHQMRNAIKGQAVADFIIDFVECQNQVSSDGMNKNNNLVYQPDQPINEGFQS